ncbi:hypothetical protein F8568_042580 [Actinomadura sp. LD22]|uniref:Type II toxin-antitoxin system RelE/ParE family toxin n=1 Tax=Actinomadura physcomitrii TaxID=2650748 RepID=A0A6I4ML17_9ACTN|nr:hypothetical protein [Actinomadura physcomitrii]MWA06918.1 hypothetical protein [Actinomadura physcomitrii]
MPDHLVVARSVRARINALTPHFRTAIQLVIMSLLSDPVPDDARPVGIEGLQYAHYTVTRDDVTVYYLLAGDTIVINDVHPDS